MSTQICGLCDGVGPIEARNFGFDLCSACAGGHLQGRLGSWGAQVEIDEVSLEEVGDKLLGSLVRGGIRPDALEADSALRVTIRVGGLQPLMAKFARHSWKTKLAGVFSRRPKTGDPLFDATIRVESRTFAFLQLLLRNDGFQSAIMTLATHCGEVEVEPGGLSVLAPLTELDLRADIPVAACALMRHVAAAS